MNIRATALLMGLFAGTAQAYTAQELRQDCQAAERAYSTEKTSEAPDAVRVARCTAYVNGVADGYAVSDYLAEQVGLRLNAFCLPSKDPDLSYRLVRSVALHTERMPPNSTVSPASLVAGAFARSFPCADSLEPRK